MLNQQPIVKIKNIHFAYENGVTVLKGANLELFPGKIIGLIGPNGVGKTTLINLISGHLVPQSGEITYQNNGSIRTPNSIVAVVEQHLSLYNNLSVAHNICIKKLTSNGFLSLVSEKKIEDETRNILKYMDIDLPIKAPVSSLLFSQKQLVEISRAIDQKFPLLVLDEPTSALDLISKKRLFAILKKQAIDGCCILLVTHDYVDLEGLTDEIVTIKEGCIERVETKMEHVIQNEIMKEKIKNVSYDLKCFVELNSSDKAFSFATNRGEVSVWHFEDALDRSLLGQSLINMTNNSVKVKLSGKSINEEADSLRKKGIEILLSDRKTFSIFPHLSVLQLYCLLTATKLPLFKRKASKKEIINRLMSAELVYSSLATACLTLSGGNQQKLLWECMKKDSNKFLILEEPLLGLDTKSQERMLNDFSSIAKNGTGVLILTCYGNLYKGHKVRYANQVEGIRG